MAAVGMLDRLDLVPVSAVALPDDVARQLSRVEQCPGLLQGRWSVMFQRDRAEQEWVVNAFDPVGPPPPRRP